MRQTRKPQLALGEARIEDIKLDRKSRDDIPAVLLGLQHLYSHEKTREKLFSLLEEHILPGTNRNVGRPGMELWRVLLMGVLKQGLGCDFGWQSPEAMVKRLNRTMVGWAHYFNLGNVSPSQPTPRRSPPHPPARHAAPALFSPSG